jgi:NAD(P)-dependent dehydrogenase (short-subunit alcohol dehydrogenase family)
MNMQTHTQKQSPKRIFITGSAAGLGRMAAQKLIADGHRVVLHCRSEERAQALLNELPGAEGVLCGDLSSLKQMQALAVVANGAGTFDAIIHNAGIGTDGPTRLLTEDGLPRLFTVNVLAPYLLTALIRRPQRLIYLASRMQNGASGESALADPLWAHRRWQAEFAYCESKLLVTMLTQAAARRWPEVCANSVHPGWVPTKMGGEDAPDDLEQGCLTQCWLAESDAPAARVSGRNFFHLHEEPCNPDAENPDYQEKLLALCAELTDVRWPD